MSSELHTWCVKLFKSSAFCGGSRGREEGRTGKAAVLHLVNSERLLRAGFGRVRRGRVGVHLVLLGAASKAGRRSGGGRGQAQRAG